MIPQLAFGPGAQVNHREAVLRCEITELIGVRTNQVHETSLSYLSHFPRTFCVGAKFRCPLLAKFKCPLL